jgi:methylenetetrahydrofolate dehydrogenase (NADP+)/methenyltetrahydrofolate cyclohydrolase
VAILMDGKRSAANVEVEVTAAVAALRARGVIPGLAIVQVGHHAASDVYVGKKVASCARVGIEARVVPFSEEAGEEAVKAAIRALNADPKVDGILVQLPLPPAWSTKAIVDTIDPDKDVDGLHPLNIGRLHASRRGLVPCTPLGVMRLLADYEVPLKGRHAVVLGRSAIVGRPMSWLLLRSHATVTTCHRHTADTPALARHADILVAAVGRPGLVTGDWIKPGAVVIDVGINRIQTESGGTRLVGDVDQASVAPVAGMLTPVPGGVGPMTVAMLLQNVVSAATARLERGDRRPDPHG